MNKGFRFYFKGGFRAAKSTFKKRGNWAKYYFLMILCLLSKVLLVSPAFALVKTRIAYRAKASNDIYVFDALKKSDNLKNFFSVIIWALSIFMIFISGIVLICGAGLLVATLGYYVASATDYRNYIALGLLIPFAIVLVVFLIGFVFLFAPGLFIFNKDQRITSSLNIYNSVASMRRAGKWTLFMINFIHFLIFVVYVGIGGIAVWLLLDQKMMITDIIGRSLGIIFGIILLVFYPKFSLARRVAIYSLFDDVVEINLDYKSIFVPTAREQIEQAKVESKAKIAKKPSKAMRKNTKRYVAKNKEEILKNLFDAPMTGAGEFNQAYIETNDSEDKPQQLVGEYDMEDYQLPEYDEGNSKTLNKDDSLLEQKIEEYLKDDGLSSDVSQATTSDDEKDE